MGKREWFVVDVMYDQSVRSDMESAAETGKIGYDHDTDEVTMMERQNKRTIIRMKKPTPPGPLFALKVVHELIFQGVDIRQLSLTGQLDYFFIGVKGTLTQAELEKMVLRRAISSDILKIFKVWSDLGGDADLDLSGVSVGDSETLSLGEEVVMEDSDEDEDETEYTESNAYSDNMHLDDDDSVGEVIRRGITSIRYTNFSEDLTQWVSRKHILETDVEPIQALLVFMYLLNNFAPGTFRVGEHYRDAIDLSRNLGAMAKVVDQIGVDELKVRARDSPYRKLEASELKPVIGFDLAKTLRVMRRISQPKNRDNYGF